MKLKLTIDEWVSKNQELDNEGLPNFNGLSPGGAASRLGVSRQRISQLVKEGKLDRIEIIDDAGHQLGVLITSDSIERFKQSGRKPGPKPKR